MKLDQQIHMKGQGIVTMTSFRNVPHLVVLSTEAMLSHAESKLQLYRWENTQFDEILPSSKFDMSASLDTWSIDGVLYISTCHVGKPWSPIFSYTPFGQEKMKLTKYVHTELPSIVRHVLIRGQHYLVFAKTGVADVFRWSGKNFMKWQVIKFEDIKEVYDVYAIRLNDFDILAFSSKLEIEFFMYDAALKFEHLMIYKPVQAIEFISTSVWLKQTLLFLRKDNMPIANQLKKLVDHLSSEHLIDSLASCLLTLQSRISSRWKNLYQLVLNSEKIWNPNKPSTISTSVLVNGTLSFENLHGQKVKIVRNVNNWIAVEDLIYSISKLMDKTNSVDVNNVVQKSGNQMIESTIYFHSVKSASGNLMSLSHFSILNHVPVTKFFSALKYSNNQNVTTSVYIQSIVADDVRVHSDHINKRKLNDFVFLHGHQVVHGYLNFEKLGAVDIHCRNTLNNVDVRDVILTSVSQNIRDEKLFVDLHASNILCTKRFDKGKLMSISNEAIYLNSVQTGITSQLYFESNFSTEHLVSSTMTEHITTLIRNSVKRRGNVQITGKKTFIHPVKILNDVTVHSTINAIKMNESVITTNTHQNITGSIFFRKKLIFNNNVVAFRINKVNLKNCCITKSKFYISGHKTFSETLTASNVYLNNNAAVNAVVLSDFEQVLLHPYDGIVKLTNPVMMKSVDVRELYVMHSDWALFQLLTNVWLKSINQNITTFSFNSVKFQNIHVESINDLNLKTDFVLISEKKATINSFKLFLSNATVANSFKVGKEVKINGLPFDAGNSVIKDTGKHLLLSGNKTFSDLSIHGSIEYKSSSGFPDEPILKVKQQHLFNLKFKKLYLRVGKNLRFQKIVVDFINGSQFGNYLSDAVLKNHNYTRSVTNKAFGFIKGNTMLSIGLIENCNLTDLQRNVITITGDHALHKNFANDIEVLRVKSISINNLNLSQLVANVLFTDGVIYFERPIEFKGKILISNLISSNLNGVDLLYLQKSAMSRMSSNLVTMHMKFASNLTLHDSFYINGSKIANVSLEQLWNFKNSQFFNHTFANIEIYGDVILNSFVNSCNITKVLNNALYLRKHKQVIKSKKSLKSLTIHGHLNVHQTINALTMQELKYSVSSKLHSEQITGNFSLSNLVVDKFSLKEVNHIDVVKLYKDAVNGSANEDLYGFKTGKRFSVDHLTALSFSPALVNNINISALLNTAVLKEGYQVFMEKCTIRTNVSATAVNLKKGVTGVRVPEDLFLINTSEVISPTVHFELGLSMSSNLSVKGRFNETYLQSFLKRVVYLDQDEVINSDLEFIEDTEIKGAKISSKLNNIQIKEIVLSSKDSLLTSKKLFHYGLITNSMNATKITGINFEDLLQFIVKTTDDANLISVVFTKSVVVSPLYGIMNGVSLKNLYSEARKKMKNTHGVSSSVIYQNLLNGHRLSQLQERSKHYVSVFAHFELLQQYTDMPVWKFWPVLGNTKKIYLNGCILPVKHMIIWSEGCWYMNGDNCCYTMQSTNMHVNKDGYMEKEKDALPGQIMHFTLRSPNHNVTGFSLHVSSFKSSLNCPKRRVVVKTKFVSKNESRHARVFNIYGDQFSTSHFLQTQDDVVLIVSYAATKYATSKGVTVYKYVWEQHVWVEQQQLISYNPFLTEVFAKKSLHEAFVVVGYQNTNLSTVSVFEWDHEYKFFDIVDNITTASPSSALWVGHGDEIFLLLASEQTSVRQGNESISIYSDRTQVYKLLSGVLTFNHSIVLRGISSMETFTYSGETYVVAICHHMNMIHIIQWKGYSGFQLIQDIHAEKVKSVTAFSTQAGDLMLAIASESGQSKILKAVIRGAAVKGC